jgi:class 3 adenylate cyclase
MTWGDLPDIRYTRGGVSVAYQVVGDGPKDLVFVTFLSNLLSLWQRNEWRHLFERLASATRLTVLNPRGMGLSDRPRNLTLEGWMDDIRAVLDAQAVERASLFGSADSANACLLFAATYPERVEKLILFRPYARVARSPDYPMGRSEEQLVAGLQPTRDHWGEREYLLDQARRVNPQWANDPEYLEWFVWDRRLAVSPAAAADFLQMRNATDITDVLRSVRVPTLVVNRPSARAEAEYVAERLPRATRVEVSGVGKDPTDDYVADAALAFLGGEAPRVVPETVLATLLFTDLVDSTVRAAQLGDRRWKAVLEAHHVEVRREVERYRGVVMDTAGDGFFCRFDGPARAIACAREILAMAPEQGLDVRAGIHSGECEIVSEKLAGLSVVIAARVAAQASAGELLVTQTVKDLVAGLELSFEPRGESELKGVPGSWGVYAVISKQR